MSQVRVNFLNWRPDDEDINNEGLTVAKNCLHDSEGYKPLLKQTGGAFSVTSFYSGVGLSSVRSMHVVQVGLNSNKIAAIAQDSVTANIADLSVGLEGETGPFTTISSGTLTSAGGVRIKSFSVAEMESGAFGVCATYDASLLAGGSTTLSITGEVTYTVTSETETAPGGDTGESSSASTSLEGTNAAHSRTLSNADTYAGIYLKSDGNEYAYGSDGTAEGTALTAWLDAGSADGLYVKASLTSGSFDIDAGTDTWLLMSVSRSWAIRQTSVGTLTSVANFSVATDSDGTNVIDTATYTLTAIRTGAVLIGTAAQHSQSRTAANCTAGVSLNSNGTEYAYSNAGSATGHSLQSWLQGGTNSDYYVKCTVLSGTLTSGTEDTWEQLNTTRGWTIQKVGPGVIKETSIRLQLDTVGDGSNIVDTAVYDLQAEYVV